MGGTHSSCSCACDTADDLLLSLASRCTKPPRSSVYHEEDDGIKESDECILMHAFAKNNDGLRGIKQSDGNVSNACASTKDVNDATTHVPAPPAVSGKALLDDDIMGATATQGTEKNSRGRCLSSLFPLSTGRSTEFDLTMLHPLDPPFLGSSNDISEDKDLTVEGSTSMKLLPRKAPKFEDVQYDDMPPYQLYRASLPSLVPNTSSPARTHICPESSSSKRTETPESNKSILTSTTASSDDDDDDDERLDDFQTPLFNHYGVPNASSRDSAIASEELISTVNAGIKGKFLVPAGQVTPRRLFEGTGFEGVEEHKDEDEGDVVSNVSLTSSPSRSSVISLSNTVAPQRLTSSKPLCGVTTGTCGGAYSSDRLDEPLIYNGVLIRGIPPSPTREHDGKSSPSRNHSSLPSKAEGCPIRLRITDVAADTRKSSREDDEWSISSSDFFSFRLPFFSASEYAVTTPSNRPWGNGIVVKMDDPNRMQVKDRNGTVVAIMRNRNTFPLPSHVIYGTRPRYPGQQPRSHRSGAKCIASNDNSCFESVSSDDIDGNIVHLYPWALVKKSGRKKSDPALIHMAVPHAVSQESSFKTDMKGFSIQAAFRGLHGFDGHGEHSHTIVSRIENAPPDAVGIKEKEVPCCLIFRNPTKERTYDATIAPGVDPVLIICYLTLHATMDSEPGHVHYL